MSVSYGSIRAPTSLSLSTTTTKLTQLAAQVEADDLHVIVQNSENYIAKILRYY